MNSEENEPSQITRRPISHKWAIFVFFASLAANIIQALKGHFDLITWIVIMLCITTLIGSFFFSRSRLTYWNASFTLILIVVRGFYYGVFQPACKLLMHDPDVRQDWLAVAFQAFGMGLLFWLLCEYTLSKTSRRYYDFILSSGPTT